MAELTDDPISTPAPNPSEPETTEPVQLTTARQRAAARQWPQDDVPHHATSRTTPGRVEACLEHAKVCARIADDNRAKDILLLDLRKATPLLDFFVIASASSRRQAVAIAYEIDADMKKLGEKKLGMEGEQEGRWILIDYGDFVVHVFSEDARTYYALEEIWGDADRVEWRDEERLKRMPKPSE